jgi:hypothetical protein
MLGCVRFTPLSHPPAPAGDRVGSFVCADEHRELPGAITAVCVTGGSAPPVRKPTDLLS